MTTKGKRLSVYLALVATPWGLATMGLASRTSWHHQVNNVNAAQDIDAAYRDGFFWGQLDGRKGRKVQPSIGRWNIEKDRGLFVAGYEKGYSEAAVSATNEQKR